MAEGYVGQPILLELALSDKATGQCPRVRITDKDGVMVTPAIDLTPTPAMGWVYVATWTPAEPGQFSATYEVYADVGHTVLTDHEPAIDHILVHQFSQDLSFQKLLGHMGENTRDDVLAYDLVTNRPLTFRRRIFPDKATADASTPGGTGEGEIATITGSAAHFDAARWETLLRTLLP